MNPSAGYLRNFGIFILEWYRHRTRASNIQQLSPKKYLAVLCKTEGVVTPTLYINDETTFDATTHSLDVTCIREISNPALSILWMSTLIIIPQNGYGSKRYHYSSPNNKLYPSYRPQRCDTALPRSEGRAKANWYSDEALAVVLGSENPFYQAVLAYYLQS